MTWEQEWKNLRKVVERIRYGTIEVRIQNGKPVLIVRAIQTIKLDTPSQDDNEGELQVHMM